MLLVFLRSSLNSNVSAHVAVDLPATEQAEAIQMAVRYMNETYPGAGPYISQLLSVGLAAVLPRPARKTAEGAQAKRRSMRVKLQTIVDEQRAWIESRGGSEAGYVAFYGAAGTPEAYGDGGELIYAADLAALHRYEAELEAAGGSR